jgi:hypothetical protein
MEVGPTRETGAFGPVGVRNAIPRSRPRRRAQKHSGGQAGNRRARSGLAALTDELEEVQAICAGMHLPAAAEAAVAKPPDIRLRAPRNYALERTARLGIRSTFPALGAIASMCDSSSKVTGFVMWASKPAARARRRSSG